MNTRKQCKKRKLTKWKATVGQRFSATLVMCTPSRAQTLLVYVSMANLECVAGFGK